MMHHPKRGLLLVGSVLLACGLLSYFSAYLEGSERRYEVRPEITLPEYRTDFARMLDAYERLMDNYLTITESNLTNVRTDIADLDRRFDRMDQKMAELSKQIESIQKELGIEIELKKATPGSETEKRAAENQPK